jgi:hypothetical protein
MVGDALEVLVADLNRLYSPALDFVTQYEYQLLQKLLKTTKDFSVSSVIFAKSFGVI